MENSTKTTAPESVYAITFFRWYNPDKDPTKLAVILNKKTVPWIARFNTKEVCTFAGRTICKATQPGNMTAISSHDKYMGVCYISSFCENNIYHIGCILLTSKNYNTRNASIIVLDALNKFSETHEKDLPSINYETNLTFDELYLQQLYQKYPGKDNIDKICQQLDETKEILLKNVESVLARGESLESLIKKSKDLSDASIPFVTETKKLNSCCWW
jgi:synaptobrevin homolog YKT6